MLDRLRHFARSSSENTLLDSCDLVFVNHILKQHLIHIIDSMVKCLCSLWQEYAGIPCEVLDCRKMGSVLGSAKGIPNIQSLHVVDVLKYQ